MNKKTFLKIIIGSFFATSMVYASGAFTPQVKSYHTMSTQELQEQVEELSLKGTLPFEMGVELMHRWSENKV
ncbi:MAG: hypothetical protein L3J43_02025 [Sulfurovum sp.]|nr:hypothetical protein [Sulfurovum sp.]